MGVPGNQYIPMEDRTGPLSAADQACVDLVYAMKPDQNHDLVERMESRHGLRQLTYMKEMGMGNDRYTPITCADVVNDVVLFEEDGEK